MQRARPGAPVDPQPVEMESFTTSAIRAAAEAGADSAQASEGETAAAREDEEPASGAATD